MKRFLLLLLALVLVLPMLTFTGLAEDTDTVETRPFVMLNWNGVPNGMFSNISGSNYIAFQKITEDGKLVLRTGNYTDIKEMAAAIKRSMDARPEGMRWLNMAPGSSHALKDTAKDVLFMEDGVEIMKAWLEEFLTEYKAIGGQLDGMLLDFEYFAAEFWYLNAQYFSGGQQDRQIYHKIVANPMYQEKLRPMLVERGFQFWPDVNEYTAEIYSIYPNSGSEYYASRQIWDACTRNLISQYLNEAVYEPLLKYYPDADVNDYTTRDTYAWLKETDESGGSMYLGGNRYKVGNSSNNNTYSYAPNLTGPVGGSDYQYNKMAAYNKTVYEDDPYNMAMWDVNLCKNMYASTPEKQISMWFAFYYYNEDRPGSTSHSPYYAEAILHMGMLDPYPFFGFIVEGHNGRLNTKEEYYQALGVSSDILAELTRVVGAADRKPIETPANWNNGYLLSGMYAGGKNYWRITPDTTDGMTLENFKISKDGDDPKFSINGQTITFPGGKIIEDGTVREIGTCGYWVETATDVMPTVSNIADRYVQYPSYSENYERYDLGATYNGYLAYPTMSWEISAKLGSVSQIVADPTDPDKQMLAVSGTVQLKNVRMPQNVTAGDGYAKQQVWEVSFILPEGLNDDAEIQLLNVYKNPGLRITGGKLYYSANDEYVEIPVTLKSGKRYRVCREVDFRNADALTCTYRIYEGDRLVEEIRKVKMEKITLPVLEIGMKYTNIAGDPILLDDYKLYPVGLTTDFEIYNANTGILQEDQNAPQSGDMAYRLSWLNGSEDSEIATVMATYYDKDGNVIAEEPVKIVEMHPGWDGVITGILENSDAEQTVRLHLELGPIYVDLLEPESNNQIVYWVIFGGMGLLAVVAVVTLLKRKRG